MEIYLGTSNCWVWGRGWPPVKRFVICFFIVVYLDFFLSCWGAGGVEGEGVEEGGT